MSTPRFTHDSDCCTYLGSDEENDYYACKSCGVHRWTFIYRYGDENSEYGSMGLHRRFSGPLLHAVVLAIRQHLFTHDDFNDVTRFDYARLGRHIAFSAPGSVHEKQARAELETLLAWEESIYDLAYAKDKT